MCICKGACMSLSFKAGITGFPPELVYLKEFIELKTENDKNHEVVLYKGVDGGRDTFVLKKNGKKTAEYSADFSSGTYEQFMKIYRILRSMEAAEMIRNMSSNRNRN